jgi:hypothetical protein
VNQRSKIWRRWISFSAAATAGLAIESGKVPSG